jgi:hypothetical protein
VLGAIGERAECSVKDSFADVDLADHGFAVLFDARWLHREPARRSDPRLAWHVVATEEEFAEWAGAAGLEGILRPELMGDATVRFLVARSERSLAAGAVLNETDGVVGVSNVFATAAGADAVWADLPAVIGEIRGERPIVGYERGDALSLAVASGFTATGELRVWVRPPS